METQKINIAVIILNWNGLNWIQKFLPIIIEKSKEANIYIADNASSDESVKFIDTFLLIIQIFILQKIVVYFPTNLKYNI